MPECSRTKRKSSRYSNRLGSTHPWTRAAAITQRVFLEHSGDGWVIIVDHPPVIATWPGATKYCGTKDHKVSRRWSPPGSQSKNPHLVRGLRLPQGLLSRFEVFVLAERVGFGFTNPYISMTYDLII